MRNLKFTDPITGRPSLLLWILLSALAVALCAVSVPVHTVLYGIPLAIAFGVGIVQMGSIPLAIIRPRLAIVLTLVSTLVLPELSRSSVDAPWPWSVSSMLSTIAVISVLAFTSRWTYPLLTWLLSVAVSIVAIATSPTRYDSLDPSVTNSIVYIAISGGALAVALLLAQRRGIRAQLVQERQITATEQAKRELVEERSRIARELHDVVAHGMSVIQVQATSAKYRLPDMSDEVAAEFDDIGATARGALTEMRQLLGCCGEPPPQTRPKPPSSAPNQRCLRFRLSSKRVDVPAFRYRSCGRLLAMLPRQHPSPSPRIASCKNRSAMWSVTPLERTRR